MATLVESHLVSDVFYKPMTEDGQRITLSSVAFEKNIRLQSGEWDAALVCADCEASFDEFEKAGQSALIHADWSALLRSDSRTVPPRSWFELHEYNYRKLKVFFLITLWRCAASQRPFAQQLELRDRLEVLRQMVLAKDPGRPEVFGVLAAKLRDGEVIAVDPRKIVSPPAPLGPDGSPWITMAFHGFEFLIFTGENLPLGGGSRQLLNSPGPWIIDDSPYEISSVHHRALELTKSRLALWGPSKRRQS
ncbi:MAG: hypothetical protein AB7K52_15920 [Phycisphaerales bacterium]